MRRKVYGKEKIVLCAKCERVATVKNKDNYPVCYKHQKSDDITWFCACGKQLEVCIGKYGTYFRCESCGNISYNRAREINFDMKKQKYKVNLALLRK